MTDYQADLATARKRLHDLVRRLREKKLSVRSFCSQFEHIYNLELDKAELSDAEAQAFAALFDKVVWYSPYEDERKEIPNYLGDDEIIQAVRDAETILRQ
jgi:hypothetical protein